MQKLQLPQNSEAPPKKFDETEKPTFQPLSTDYTEGKREEGRGLTLSEIRNTPLDGLTSALYINYSVA